MEVILSKDVEKLGKTGSVVKVKDGFARNFLIPNNLAVPKSASSMKKLQAQEESKLLQQEKAKKEAEALKEKLAALSLTLAALVQEDDKLYGSITAADISAQLKEEGFDIDKSFIILDEPIKSLGIFEVPVKLHTEVIAKIKVWVVKK